jgi:hypothetical protein
MNTIQRSKTIDLNGRRWELRKLSPIVGSFIWQRLMGACFKAQESIAHDEIKMDSATAEAAAKATPEERLRTLCGIAFMHLSLDDFTFTQNSCMKAISRYEMMGESEQPIPIMTSDGSWAAHELEDNPFLVTKLTVEALVFSLASFLSEGA